MSSIEPKVGLSKIVALRDSFIKENSSHDQKARVAQDRINELRREMFDLETFMARLEKERVENDKVISALNLLVKQAEVSKE